MKKILLTLFMAGFACTFAASTTLAQTNADGSVNIPIYATNGVNYTPSHYTIYAAIGGGPLVPYLFDTGAPYLMSFYNSDLSQTNTNGLFTFSTGLTYYYQSLNDTISLGSNNSTSVIVSSGSINYGQVRYTNGDAYNSGSIISNPTLNGTYGDFGAGFYGNSALGTILTQMPLTNTLSLGYTLDLTTNLIAASGQGSLTLGVSQALLDSYATNPNVIKMALSSSGTMIPTAGGTTNGYGRAQVANVAVALASSNGMTTNSLIPYVLDTGGGPNAVIYSTNLAGYGGATNLVVSTTNAINPQILETVLSNSTPWGGGVDVISNPTYGGLTNGGERMNSGGYFFDSNIVTFDLKGGYVYILPVGAVPEPSSPLLLLTGGLLLVGYGAFQRGRPSQKGLATPS